MAVAEEFEPKIVVLGGPNGAGKSTCAARLLPENFDLRQFVNADTIAAGLSAFAPETVALQAGRILLDRLNALQQSRQSFAVETTLASRSLAPFLRRLRNEGYRTHLIYVWLESPELAVARVKARVRKGGHHIPEDVVRRRYARGIANFWNLYRPLAHSWTVCDNSGSDPLILARGEENTRIEVLIEERFREFERTSRQKDSI